MSMLSSVIDNDCIEYMVLIWSLEMAHMLSVSQVYWCHICGSCVHWIHNKCSGIKDTLCPGPDFNRASCLGIANPIDEQTKWMWRLVMKL